MEEILASLPHLQFPLSRQEIIDAAVQADLPMAMVTRLESLPEEHYRDAEEVSRDLVAKRAESNPGLVSIIAEPCPDCGFPRLPGKPHSCVEEKARFAESAQSVTDEFEIPQGPPPEGA